MLNSDTSKISARILGFGNLKRNIRSKTAVADSEKKWVYIFNQVNERSRLAEVLKAIDDSPKSLEWISGNLYEGKITGARSMLNVLQQAQVIKPYSYGARSKVDRWEVSALGQRLLEELAAD